MKQILKRSANFCNGWDTSKYLIAASITKQQHDVILEGKRSKFRAIAFGSIKFYAPN